MGAIVLAVLVGFLAGLATRPLVDAWTSFHMRHAAEEWARDVSDGDRYDAR